MDDYSKQLSIGRRGCFDYSLAALNDLYETPLDGHMCEYLNITVCEVTEEAEQFTVGIYSPSSAAAIEPIVIPVNFTDYKVLDQSGKDRGSKSLLRIV